MGKTTSISKLSLAKRALIEAKSLDDILSVGDMASAIRAYAKASGESLEIQNAASDLRLSAERKAGELLASMDKNEGGRPAKTSDIVSPVSLNDIGITKKQSSRWQLASKLPGDQYASLVEYCNTSGKELTQAAVLRAARIHVFGERDPSEIVDSADKSSNANLVDLIAMARTAIADLVDAFGELHKQTLVSVLRDEIETLEGAINADC